MIRRGSFLSRFLALSIAFAPIAAGAVYFALWAERGWREASARLAAAERLERETSAANIQGRAYGGLLERWRNFVASPGSGLAPPSSDGVAEADIAARTRAAFEASGGAVSRWTSLDAVTVDGLRRSSIELFATAPASALDAALEALETEPPYLFVDYLEARPGEAEGVVALRLRLSSFRLSEAPR